MSGLVLTILLGAIFTVMTAAILSVLERLNRIERDMEEWHGSSK